MAENVDRKVQTTNLTISVLPPGLQKVGNTVYLGKKWGNSVPTQFKHWLL